MTGNHAPNGWNGPLQAAAAELRRRLKAGEPCRAETLLAAYPALAADEEAALELLYREFVARRQLGEKPDPAERYGRFPHWRDRLERLFLVHEILGPEVEMAESTEPSPSFQGNPCGFERYRAPGKDRPRRHGRGLQGRAVGAGPGGGAQGAAGRCLRRTGRTATLPPRSQDRRPVAACQYRADP